MTWIFALVVCLKIYRVLKLDSLMFVVLYDWLVDGYLMYSVTNVHVTSIDGQWIKY